jgi:hypothetical protein
MGKRESTKNCLMVQYRFFFILFLPIVSFSQIKWQNVDSVYGPLPKSVHVFYTDAPIDTGAFRAFYVIADLKDRKLNFTTDTTYKRRLTPSQFYNKNHQPLVVVNGTFFSFETNQNLNLVVKKGKLVAHNRQVVALKGKDTLKYAHVYPSSIGVTKNRTARVFYTFTDSSRRKPYAMSFALNPIITGGIEWTKDSAFYYSSIITHRGVYPTMRKWKAYTAIGGGPVLLQNGQVKISNNEELKFAGKAINDKHPRTAMGYTKDDKLIILVIEGRNPNAGGANLTQEAQILKDLGCVEALNLDGGGSSCLLINGKETIKPSDKSQRAVPAVFIIKSR